MKILLSNDDGAQAPGLAALHEALLPLAELTVYAPDRNRSGASSSLTLEQPLRVQRLANGFYAVNGTPSDCVHLALNGVLGEDPDMVVSGINAGANLGDDTLYSGTVAAAIEGRFLGRTAIALSLVGRNPVHYATAARVARQLVEQLMVSALPADVILNVNVPDLPYEQLQGMAVTRLGHRHRAEPVLRAQDPHGRPIYWIGPAGPGQDAGKGTDFHAVEQGKVSITPIQVDLTAHRRLAVVEEWCRGLSQT